MIPAHVLEPDTVFFGPRWGNPLAEAVQARQAPTPVGRPCRVCKDRFRLGDQGFLRTVMREQTLECPEHGEHVELLGGSRIALHMECEIAAVFGHDVGICGCTGYPSTRANAMRVWDEVVRRGRDLDRRGRSGHCHG